MSDPRNVAHAKKVTQEKKHQGTGAEDASVAQRGKKRAAAKKGGSAEAAEMPGQTAASESATPNESPSLPPAPAALEASLAVLAKLKDMEFHSRANLERLAELMLTVEDELKQKELAGPIGEVYGAQDAFQTKLTALLESYKAECERLQGGSA